MERAIDAVRGKLAGLTGRALLAEWHKNDYHLLNAVNDYYCCCTSSLTDWECDLCVTAMRLLYFASAPVNEQAM